MKLLFDLVHPAHALFFHHAIEALKGEGAEVAIASRVKDVLVPLLDGLGHTHEVLTSARDGVAGLAGELGVRNWRLWRMARRFRPDVMASCGGVSISHVGRLLGIPSLSFYDTEHAALQNRIAIPFITEWHVQESWSGPEARDRTFRFAGTRHSAYLHPDHFVPDAERAKRAGWEQACDNYLVRLVAWRANHDIGKVGLTIDELRSVVEHLSQRGRVHISSEGPLPDEFEPYRFRGGVLDFHHLLAKCRLQFGESATVSTEAVTLGVPTVFYCDLEYGYIREQADAGLIRHVRRGGASPVAAIEASLTLDPEAYRTRARAFVAGKGDVNRYIARAIEAAVKKYR
jgi:predicted glycosyltransferase